MHQNWPPMPPPTPPYAAPASHRGKPRTARTWWAAIALGVVLGVAWAVPLFYLMYVWLVVLPVWLLLTVLAAVVCFLVGISHKRAIAYGVGILLSIPIAIGLPIAYIAIASHIH